MSTSSSALIAPASGESQPAARWFEDRAQAAFELAEQRGQLVFADLWAPWCHTCLSMREHVLDVRRVPSLGRVVLLAIDTERAENASFLQQYPVGVWPTFYLIDPRTRSVRGRWLGAASPEQLDRFIGDGAQPGSQAAILLSEADAAAAKRAWLQAAKFYRGALESAPAGWPRRGDVLVSLASSLYKQESFEECLQLALSAVQWVPPSISAADFAATTLGCAERAGEGSKDSARRVRQALAGLLQGLCASAAPGASPDDQADACGSLRRAREALGDREGARQAAEQGLAVIERATLGAKPDSQLIYDWERTSNLVYLGRKREALELLMQRERDCPQSYNPAHYLARLYRDAGEWEAGLAAIERALAKAYGPRRAGLVGVKVDLLRGAGRTSEARATLEQQLSEYRALPEGQKQPEAEATVQKRLSDWPLPQLEH
ncbi:MAG TPA: thioredoxin family protein [Polyangiaceae bacterium]|nr:thioredoxin family protein [Polyangiaceae bacterium]